MKFYVACSSAEIDRAEKMIAALAALGGVCTHDWTRVMRANRPDHELTDEVLLPELRRSFRGAVEAEHLFVLAPATSSTGLFVELGGGAAPVRTAEIHACGPRPHAWLRALATLTHATDEDAVRWFEGEMVVMRSLRGHA